MMVNVKLAKDGDGENNVKSWIAMLPADSDVSILLDRDQKGIQPVLRCRHRLIFGCLYNVITYNLCMLE